MEGKGESLIRGLNQGLLSLLLYLKVTSQDCLVEYQVSR